MSQKPPILLLHGALGSADQMGAHAKKLEENFTPYTFTFSGHGGRGDISKPFTITAFAKELSLWLDEQGLAPLPVFGYSMGGYVALWLARQPKKYFTHILTYGTKFAWSPETAAQEVKRLQPAALEAKVPQFALSLARRHHPHDWRLVMEKTATMMLGLGNAPLLTAAALGQISIPVTLMLGTQDRMVSPEESIEAAACLPNSTYKQLEGQPHPVEQLDPGLLQQEILTALHLTKPDQKNK